jgi:hypothetical protein
MDLTLEELSDELLFDVFLRLDYFDLSRALIVNQRWHQIGCDSALWKELYRYHFWSKIHGGSRLKMTNFSSQTGFGWKVLFEGRKAKPKWREPRLNSQVEKKDLSGHRNAITCLQTSFSSFISGSRDWTARIWESGQCVAVLPHDSTVTAVQWLDEETVMTAASDVQLWSRGSRSWLEWSQDVEDGEKLEPMVSMGDGLALKCAVADWGGLQVISSTGSNLQLWDVNTGQKLQTADRELSGIFKLVWADNSVISVSNQDVMWWDLRAPMIKSTIRIQVRDHIASLDYDPLNNLILVGSDGRSAFEMDVSKRSLFATYPHTGRVTAVQYFNEYILTGSSDRLLQAWNRKLVDHNGIGAPTARFELGIGTLTCMHANASWVTYGGTDEAISIWYFPTLSRTDEEVLLKGSI